MFGIAFVCYLWDLCLALGLSVCWLGDLCLELHLSVICGTYVWHWVCLFVGWVTYVWKWLGYLEQAQLIVFEIFCSPEKDCLLVLERAGYYSSSYILPSCQATAPSLLN